MSFKKYSRTGTWDDSLHIFLYVELLDSKKEHSSVTIDNYQTFELSDQHILKYDKWIDASMEGAEIIHDWIDRYAEQVIRFEKEFGTTFKPKVELWSDRKKTGYYKEKLQASFEFENYLEKYFREKYDLELGPYLTPQGQYYEGENELGIEIKNDTLIKKTGNIYIEYAEKSRASNDIYIDSGILKDDKSTYFLIGDKEKFWVFRKQRLIEIYHEEDKRRKEGKPSERGIQFKVIATSRGFVYPVRHAEKEALKLDALVQEIKAKK